MKCLIPLMVFTEVTLLVLSVSRKYYLIQPGKTWTDAQTYCRAEYTDLGIVRNTEDLIQLQNEIQTQNFNSNAWIGLYNDINRWRWSVDNEPVGSFKVWRTGQLDNWMGDENCGLIDSTGWLDSTCEALYPVICVDDRNTGNQKYIFNSIKMTWSEAQAYCRQKHTDLASAKDPAENAILIGLITGWTWFGLFKDSWKWTDQTNFSILNWISGEPNNGLGKEDCGYSNNGLVGDAQCSDVLPFFCYGDVRGQQQIVRVKVQSSEDVNDPAVMVAILDQINQKLGLAGNITLKWRKLSDGEVFYKEGVEKNYSRK